ncbi:MAG: PorT family protein [Spirochaetes bacterium]|nr:PorT family protein [Spirochaetota bacterium]
MKKVVLVLIFLLMASYLFADVKIGGAIGGNGNLGGGFIVGTGLGFEAGVFANVYLSRMFSIQPELNFIYIRVNEDGSTETARFIEVPVLAKLNFGRFSVFAGPAIQFIVGDIELDRRGNNFTICYSPDSRLAFGGIVGIGYALPVGNGNFLFELRSRSIITGGVGDDTEGVWLTTGLRVGYAHRFF